MNHGVVLASLISAVAAAVPLLYASLGELVNEKAGVMNIGIEGVMMIGAFAGFAVAVNTSSVALGLLAGAGAGAVFSAVMIGLPSVMLGVPQILSGLAAWFVGLGLASQLGNSYVGRPLKVELSQINIPLLDKIPWLGEILFQQTWPVYLAIFLAILVALLLSRTRAGLNLTAVGEDPSAAYAAGVPVRLTQMAYVSLGGALMGVGGAVFSVIIAAGFQGGMTGGRGFVAFALVIFVGWRPLALIGASYLFGIMLILVNVGQSHGWAINSNFLSMAPYALTVIALSVRAALEMRRAVKPAMPAALGQQFVPGQR